MFGINDTNNQQATGAGTAGPAPQPAEPAAPMYNPIHGPAELPTPITPSPAPVTPASEPAAVAPSEDLLDLKKKALDSLAPMVNKLDQKPEEKFKTLMMLIQASDNSGLVGQAYEAANQIPDEKERAQALIDVVNEINYFTQTKNQPS